MGMIIDGIFASEAIDRSGEILKIDGLDISDLKEGRAILNLEHRNPKDEGNSLNDAIGRIIYAKKIFSLEDCDNERERAYYKQVECPMLYGKAMLFDDVDPPHQGAMAASAIIRHCDKHKIPLLLKYSIEGSTLTQDGPLLKRCIARGVAATLRPANGTAVSGLLSENGKKVEEPSKDDPLSFLIGTKKCENPDHRTLGGSVETLYVSETSPISSLTERLTSLNKAITGGQYNVAPGSLTGGAALQRECFSSELQDVGFRNKAKAALRDYDPHEHGDFRTYAKHQLPEASESFLDRFADAVKDFKASKKQILTKAEDKPQDKFKLKSKKYKQTLSGLQEKGAEPPPAETPEFKVKPRKRLKQGEAHFDHSTGTLHTPEGSFKVHIPKDPKYMEILKDPELNKIHDTAMKNWMTVHKTLQAGKAPPEMVALASMFSAMSPSTSVPLQELAMGHLTDMMGAPTGKGGFEGLDPTKKMSTKQSSRYDKEWKALVNGQRLPAWERDHFAKKTSGIWTGEGKRYKIGLGQQKWGGVKNYHELHGALTDLVAKHGTDARSIAGKLNEMKYRAGTKAHKEGEPEVKAFAPKTIRYLLGMLGAGNSIIPDTHFIRHSFGLHETDPKNAILKKYLWNEKHEPLLAELDKYYYNNHPAVAHTRAKMQQKFGEDLGEQALFPAFWLHWLTIQPHEQSRGWFEKGRARNAETDHGVFWNAAKRVLDKYGIPHDHKLIKHEFEEEGSMATRVAHATKELENQFGFVPATMAMYALMVPAVLHNKEMQKAEALTDRLQELVKAEKEDKKPKAVVFQGKNVIPGELEVIGGPANGLKFPLVNIGSGHHHILNEKGKLMRVEANNPNLKINSKPKSSDIKFNLVDAVKHGVPGLSERPEQRELIHGIDLMAPALPGLPGQMKGISAQHHRTGWRKSKAGHISYTKPSAPMEDMMGLPPELKEYSSAHREAAFHNLARDFFGLGQHVPTTATFHDPIEGEPYSSQKMVQGAEHMEDKHKPMLNMLNHTGQLDKLMLMDMILGNGDRHRGNFVLTPNKAPYLHLIDNGLAGVHPSAPYQPDYLDKKGFAQPLHPEAAKWASKLNPQELHDMMGKMGIPDSWKSEAKRRLEALQKRIAQGSVTKANAFYAPWTH